MIVHWKRRSFAKQLHYRSPGALCGDPSAAALAAFGTKPPLWLSIDGMAENGALQTGFEIEEAGCGQPPLTKAVLQDVTLIAVIEMSQSSWFVAGIAPGVGAPAIQEARSHPAQQRQKPSRLSFDGECAYMTLPGPAKSNVVTVTVRPSK